MQKEIKKEIKSEKLKLKDKIEEGFCSGSVRDAWRHMKTLTGKGGTGTIHDGMTDAERKEQAEQLNDFYCRFD